MKIRIIGGSGTIGRKVSARFSERHNPIAMEKVVNGYVRSVEGKSTGEIIRVYDRH